jgi:hypothetical protein
VPGDLRVRLSDRKLLAIGNLIELDVGRPSRLERVAIVALEETGSTDDLAATAVLAHPLRRAHAAGAAVRRTTPVAPGSNNVLSRPCEPGDVTLFASTMLDLDATADAIELSGGGPAPEYHSFALYQSIADADARVRLPPLHRLAQVRLRVTHALEPTPLTLDLQLAWGVLRILPDMAFP